MPAARSTDGIWSGHTLLHSGQTCAPGWTTFALSVSSGAPLSAVDIRWAHGAIHWLAVPGR
eukprot:11191023-Lingulodinium_polyedra.AAC.1